jgi:hypothetical protein
MRAWLGGFLIVFVLWAAYYVGPYVALFRIETALQAHDVHAITEEVNFRAVRISVARQLVEAYQSATGKAKQGEPPSNLEASLGAIILDPVLAEYVTPTSLVDLLNGSAQGRLAGRSAALFSPAAGSLRSAWRFFVTSEARGFRVVTFFAPLDRPKAEQFGLSFRFRPFSWRATGLHLPDSVTQQLVQEMKKRTPAD